MKTLLEHIVPGAFHNSKDRRDPPRCHPGTRKAVMQDILTWATNPSNLRLLMWVYGPAGAGKSAILQTFAEYCEEHRILGGSFFFLHTDKKRNIADHLITTLSYQMAQRIPRFQEYLADIILEDPSIFSQNLASQMTALILHPMASVAATQRSNLQTYVFLIDGLDECEIAFQREIITLVFNSVSPHLRFIISSRPDLAIRNTFNLPNIQNQTHTLALDDHYLPDVDIHQFLEEKFQDIKKYHTLRDTLPQKWPGVSVMDTLVRNSSGQFIYAATVMRYIESPHHDPNEHLATVLKAKLSPEQQDRPFALLDALYHQIFSTVKDLEAVLDILRVQLSDTITLFTFSLRWFEALLGYRPRYSQLILCDMHSLISFKDTNNEYTTNINFHHKSLTDFLFDPLRSRHLYIDQQKVWPFILTNLLKNFKGE